MKLTVMLGLLLVVSLCLLAFLVPGYLSRRGANLGLKGADRIFTLCQKGDLDLGVREGSISDKAAANLKKVGNGSGRFSSYQVEVYAVQASGMPCWIKAKAFQGTKSFDLDLEFNGKYCEYVNLHQD